MNLGEILDRTLQIYRSRFLAFFSIAAVPALALMAIGLADNRWFTTTEKGQELLWSLLRSFVHYHFAAILGLLVFPVFVKIASDAILEQATPIRVALQFALSRWRSFLWIAFLKTIAQLIIPGKCHSVCFCPLLTEPWRPGAFPLAQFLPFPRRSRRRP